ncbi:unnamed protein product [Litomosoides sigmodontis]|uniref:Uncharacterized protein n=1 Tax=Litomosoides sigmodontis TaxID=42156 RepID=A0A3P6SHG9_LITSI|nr:unnamed protein product [Litomosoides sigmodontis]
MKCYCKRRVFNEFTRQLNEFYTPQRKEENLNLDKRNFETLCTEGKLRILGGALRPIISSRMFPSSYMQSCPLSALV